MVVLFDVDRTLLSGNCTAALAKALASAGVVPRSAVASLAVQQLLYRLKRRSFPALMGRTYRLIQGCEITRVEECAERVVHDVIAPTIYPEAAARIAMKKNRYGNIEDIVLDVQVVTALGVVERPHTGPRESIGTNPKNMRASSFHSE